MNNKGSKVTQVTSQFSQDNHGRYNQCKHSISNLTGKLRIVEHVIPPPITFQFITRHIDPTVFPPLALQYNPLLTLLYFHPLHYMKSTDHLSFCISTSCVTGLLHSIFHTHTHSTNSIFKANSIPTFTYRHIISYHPCKHVAIIHTHVS